MKNNSIAPDRTPPSPVFSADMTQLIAADSYLVKPPGSSPIGALRQPMDPYAGDAFEKLCNLLTNNHDLHLAPPPRMPDKPRPIMAAWSALSSAPPAPEGPKLSGEELCRTTAAPFCAFAAKPGAVNDLVGFAEFQFSDAELMKTFWLNNHDADLRLAEEILLSGGAVSHVFDAHFAQFNTPALPKDRTSIGAIRPGWSPARFALAYIFWAFAKGHGYTRKLSEEHIYVIHWLRQHAVATDPQARRAPDKFVVDYFDWAELLGMIFGVPQFAFDDEDVLRALFELRSYTARTPVPPPSKPMERVDFAITGLEGVLPEKLVPEEGFDVVRRLVQAGARTAMRAMDGPSPEEQSLWREGASNVIVATFDLFVPTAVKEATNASYRRLRLWPHRRMLSRLVKSVMQNDRSCNTPG